MLEPATTILLTILGTKALDLISSAVEDHAKDLVKGLFEKGEQILFGKKEKDALEDAYRNVLTSASVRVLEALGNVLQLTASSDSIGRYRDSVERFLKNGTVAEHLLDTVRDLSDESFPDPALLEREWAASGGEELVPGAWHMVAANFRKGAREKTFITPQLREVLNARNLDQIRLLGEKLLGVQVTVKHEQYVSVMRKTFAPVHLANIAPSFADDPGTLVVTDIFEPQDLRENPPPVEIAKDELENLARQGKLDQSDESVVIALLEDGEKKDAVQKLRYQLSSYAEQAVQPVLKVIAPPTDKQRNRLIVITGEPGSGKSMLLRYLLLGILDPPPDPNNPAKPLAWTEGFTEGPNEHFPFLIELRDYHFTCEAEDEVNSLMDYAHYLGETMGYGIDDQWLDRRLKEGPSLVMFDGLDEIFSPERRENVMKQIVGFTETYPKARVVVTSRPHGYHEGILRPAGFAHYRLQDLDRGQKESFTRAWFGRVFPNSTRDAEQRIDRVLGSVDRSPSVRWLAGNPLLLTIMCLIAREKELPRERSRFYEQCIDVLAHQWEINNHLKDNDLAFLDVDDKKDLLRHIAFEMQSSDAGLRGNFIGERDLVQLTQAWFEGTFADHTGAKARRAADRMIEGLWQRNYLLCPRGPKLYGFLHRTFMEFLTAAEYVRRFEKTDDFTLDDLDAVFREHGNDPEWSEVLRLICGEIGDEFADSLLRTLLTLREFPTAMLSEENQPSHLLLAIRCMGELRGLSKMEELGAFALERCVEFFRMVQHNSRRDNQFLADLVQAARDVGTRWPKRDHFASIALEPGDFEYWGHQFYPEFEAATFGHRGRITKFAGVAGDACHSAHTMRSSGLRALCREWADAETRGLLTQSAADDKSDQVRYAALGLLAGREQWADAETRGLLTQSAADDKSDQVRYAALGLLAGREQWADAETRGLLTQSAADDKSDQVRYAALGLLAGREQWADAETRRLVTQYAADDKSDQVRSTALGLLAGREQWADAETRRLVTQYAADDKSDQVRSTALGLLAGREQWADAETRRLVTQYAADDKSDSVRAKALDLLGGRKQWAVHKETLAARQGFIELILDGAEPESRGQAACSWFRGAGRSDPLADAKQRVFSRDVDGAPPYIDPREPVSAEHLARVANSAGLTDEECDRLVEQMNAALGWDIRLGRAQGETRTDSDKGGAARVKRTT